jgi:hypothetical protein
MSHERILDSSPMIHELIPDLNEIVTAYFFPRS